MLCILCCWSDIVSSFFSSNMMLSSWMFLLAISRSWAFSSNDSFSLEKRSGTRLALRSQEYNSIAWQKNLLFGESGGHNSVRGEGQSLERYYLRNGPVGNEQGLCVPWVPQIGTQQSNLIQHKTGNRLRHASGPVRANLPPVTFIETAGMIDNRHLLSRPVQCTPPTLTPEK